MSRVGAAVRRHGVAKLPAALSLRAVATLRERHEAATEAAFDRARGIETAGVDERTRYQPVHPAAFAELLGHVRVEPAVTTFVDIGAGRGRALFLAAEYGFSRVLGVGFDAEHHRLAAANLVHYRGARGAAIRLVHGDATALELPAAPLVVFVYNPFGREPMSRLLERLCEGGRPRWVVYEAPLERDLFDAAPEFELIAERTGRAGASPRRPRFAIYLATSSAARRRSA